MQRPEEILKTTTAGGTLTTNSAVGTDGTIAFFIYNDTDSSLDFDAQLAIEDSDDDGDFEWVPAEDPALFTQITFTVGIGLHRARFLTGSVTGMRYRLVCDSTGATGTVRIVAVR